MATPQTQKKSLRQMTGQADKNRQIPAWLLSVLLHTTIVVVLGLTWQVTPRGTQSEPERSGGIVISRQVDGRQEYFDGQESAQQQSTQETDTTSSSPLLTAEDAAINTSGILPLTDEILTNSDPGAALPSANDLTHGADSSKPLGGKGETYVFGVKGEGTKFVYVFDRSGSMSGYAGRPLAAAKQELLSSLKDLSATHQFQIIFYNEKLRIFNPTGGTPRLVFGDDRGKLLAERFVKSIIARGGTQHMEALRMALNMRPDVVFFLTDADEPQLTPKQLATIRRLNRSSSIHAIEFGYGPSRGGDNFLIRLARENRGQHAYVDISQLAPKK